MLLQRAGTVELQVVRDADAWNIDPALYAAAYEPEDRLIDSAGVEYRLEPTDPDRKGRYAIVPTGRRFDANDVQSIAERHVESVGRKPEWLAQQLRGVAEGNRIRATILYLTRLAAQDASGAVDDGDGSG